MNKEISRFFSPDAMKNEIASSIFAKRNNYYKDSTGQKLAGQKLI